MLAINMADVVNVLNTCRPYLIGLAVVLVLALIVVIAVRKMDKAKRKLIRSEAGIAVILAIVVVVNMICWGPMNSMISLATGNDFRGDVSGSDGSGRADCRGRNRTSEKRRQHSAPCGFQQTERVWLGFHQPVLRWNRFRFSV